MRLCCCRATSEVRHSSLGNAQQHSFGEKGEIAVETKHKEEMRLTWALAASAVALLASSVALLAACCDAAALSSSSEALMPITGTFLDVAYDQRMLYTNAVSANLTCSEWHAKFQAFAALGIDTIIFQAVHDDRWGSYYPSALPFMQLWNGTCPDVVGTALASGVELGIRIFLSCEYVHTEFDSVTDPVIMADRLRIMDELVQRYQLTNASSGSAGASFAGWYFSAEAYLEPYFMDDFLAYLNNLTTHAASVTPSAKVFISPYGTRFAVADATFITQLQNLPVDFVAYQDEVGCVRDELPAATAGAALQALSLAHAVANRSQMWVNIESFTWQDYPNNDTSPLVPAEPERVAAQLANAKNALAAKVITFTAQGMYESPNAQRPWGGPNNTDLYTQYLGYLGVSNTAPTTAASLPSSSSTLTAARSAVLVTSVLNASLWPCHQNILRADDGSASTPAPECPYCSANLTDGMFGPQNPYNGRWSAFALSTTTPSGTSLWFNFSIPLAQWISVTEEASACRGGDNNGGSYGSVDFLVGVSTLQVSAEWFVNGSASHAVVRNISAFVPTSVTAFVGTTNLGSDTAERWFRTAYDIRRVLFLVPLPFSLLPPRYSPSPTNVTVSILLEFNPKEVARATSPLVFVDEVFVVPNPFAAANQGTQQRWLSDGAIVGFIAGAVLAAGAGGALYSRIVHRNDRGEYSRLVA